MSGIYLTVLLSISKLLWPDNNFMYTENAQQQNQNIHWNKTEYDFGLVKQGRILIADFTCYNLSDSVLIFENVQASCGCVIPTWNSNPIQPKDSVTITVKFNTENYLRKHNKTIAVYSNRGLFELFIRADIRK